MKCFRLLTLLLIVLPACNSEAFVNQNGSNENGTDKQARHTKNSAKTEKTINEQKGNLKESPPVTLEDLNRELARFKDQKKWHYGSRPDGLPVGTWYSQDKDRSPLIFEKDGTAKVGFLWRDGKGEWMTGRYAVSDQGLIVVAAKKEGVRSMEFFRVENDKLVGARGPAPRVLWEKSR